MNRFLSVGVLSILVCPYILTSTISVRTDDTREYRTVAKKEKNIKKTFVYGLLLGSLVGGYQGATASGAQEKTAAALGIGSVVSLLGWFCGKQLQESENEVVDELECGMVGCASATAGYVLGLAVGMLGRVCAGYGNLQDIRRNGVFNALSKILSVVEPFTSIARDVRDVRRPAFASV